MRPTQPLATLGERFTWFWTEDRPGLLPKQTANKLQLMVVSASSRFHFIRILFK